ncbi:MAG TPA: hypothetical protein VGI39_07545 [Polyangiaceae bacterium]
MRFTLLAPSPDFRYVGLDPGPRLGVRGWASLVATGTTFGAGMLHEMGPKGALLTVLGASAAALVLHRARGPSVYGRVRTALSRGARRRARGSGRGIAKGAAVAMAIVPWGILVQPDMAPRVLRWAAVRRVSVETIYGRDGGTPMTLWSVVTIETEHERFAGRTPGAVAIERLIAHVDAYAEEQAQEVALDIDGQIAAEGPMEPVIEPLLSAARASVLGGGQASTRLGLPANGYRGTAEPASHASEETIALLHDVLADRAPRSPDPRPFAAVLAAELGVLRLSDALLELVQSPHPVVAAVAKVAARKLGTMATKVGAVAEVAPFLHERDVEALAAWGDAPLRLC